MKSLIPYVVAIQAKLMIFNFISVGVGGGNPGGFADKDTPDLGNIAVTWQAGTGAMQTQQDSGFFNCF